MSNWEDILKEVSSSLVINNLRNCWFRGHSNSKYKLNSSLYRISKNQNQVLMYERNIYYSFVNYGSEYCSFNDNKDWNTLFLMQHHGLDTRLLDWTGSFLVALYFANMNRMDESGDIKEGCIWILNPYILNNKSSGIDRLLSLDTLPDDYKNYRDFFDNKIKDLSSLAIIPRRNNPRIHMQDGFFTIQGTKNTSLEDEMKGSEALKKIILPPDTYEESMNYLKLNGMNYYTLFGGIDGLCKHIKKERLLIQYDNL
jgi:hypothetical protein